VTPPDIGGDPARATEMLRIERQDGVAVVTIAREKQLNALSSQVLSELLVAVQELEHDLEVRAVVLTGAGDKAFVAGADIAEMTSMTPTQARGIAELGGAVGEAIERAHTPWIAAVNGFALGGGCELAMCCDFIYASTRAKFGQPEVKLGVVPGFGGTQRLSRRVGVGKAKELCLTGDTIGAEEALRIGLCEAVFAPEDLMGKAIAAARRAAANGPLAVAEAKRLIHVGQSISLEAACELERVAFAGLFATDDQKEGMTAFAAKRPPAWKGR
jgi:enoyl-CoA hydratase